MSINAKTPVAEWPADRKPGCLPRKWAPGVRFPMAAERITIIDRDDWPKYTGKVSMRPFVKTVLDQGSVGSCATEGAAQALMITRAYAGKPHVVLNPWFIYHTTSHGSDSGSSIDENLEFIQEFGCAPESVWPRSKGWRAKPSAEANAAALEFRGVEVFDISSIDEMVSAELSDFAVVYGSNGHCVVKVEHQNDRQGLDINSWSESWGDNGFGVWATYSQVNWGYGAWALRTVK